MVAAVFRPLSIFASAVFASQAYAQRAPLDSGSTLRFAMTGSQEARRDDVASPLIYRGVGGGAAVAYTRHTRDRGELAMSVEARIARLSPSTTVIRTTPTQTFTGGSAHVAFLRRIPVAQRANLRALIGGDAMLNISGVRHTYADPERTQHGFGLGYAGVGPRMGFRASAGRNVLETRLSVPVVALMQRPYADVRLLEQGLDLRLASVDRFRQVNGEIALLRTVTRRIGLGVAYRFDFTRLDDLQPLRTAAHSLSLELFRASR